MKLSYRSYVLIFFLLAFITQLINAQSPNWAPPAGNTFQFSANVIAQIKLSDTISNNANDKVAFFDGTEIKGLADAVSLGNGLYLHFITIYSNQAIDTLNISVYHHSTNQIYEVQQPFIFQSQLVTGNVDNPYVINIYPNNNAPIWLLPVTPQISLQGVSFAPIDMSQYLVQPENYPVDWSYTNNSFLNVNFNGSILSVSAIAGFTGQTYLTVRATEQSVEDRTLSEGERAYQQQEQYAEVVIEFNVLPLYAAPQWQPLIPGQSILLGQQFDTIGLHNYENQYTGASIRYDYKPVLEEKIPNDTLPNWQITQSYGTNMTIVARPDYTPKHQLFQAGDVLAAFSGNELRGLTQRNPENGLFYLTIGGENQSMDTITLIYYSTELKKILKKEKLFVYEPFGILGNDENPFVLEFAPIVPIIPDVNFSGGIYDMPIQIVDTSFVGSMTFTFSAMDPVYSLFLRDDIDVTFCVVADSSELSVFYQDQDGDGLGNPLVFVWACSIPEGYVTNDDDCNDTGEDNSVTLVLSENSGMPNDGFICATANANLSVEQSAQSYLWNTGDTTQNIQINPTETTVYTVTVTFMPGCFVVESDTVHVEGLVVKTINNSGPGSLRSIVDCAAEGSTITYDIPDVTGTYLTQVLTIDKTLTIQGTLDIKPKIILDFSQALSGLFIEANKKLILENVNLKTLNSGGQKTISGSGSIEITGETSFSSQ